MASAPCTSLTGENWWTPANPDPVLFAYTGKTAWHITRKKNSLQILDEHRYQAYTTLSHAYTQTVEWRPLIALQMFWFQDCMHLWEIKMCCIEVSKIYVQGRWWAKLKGRLHKIDISWLSAVWWLDGRQTAYKWVHCGPHQELLPSDKCLAFLDGEVFNAAICHLRHSVGEWETSVRWFCCF